MFANIKMTIKFIRFVFRIDKSTLIIQPAKKKIIRDKNLAAKFVLPASKIAEWALDS